MEISKKCPRAWRKCIFTNRISSNNNNNTINSIHPDVLHTLAYHTCLLYLITTLHQHARLQIITIIHLTLQNARSRLH